MKIEIHGGFHRPFAINRDRNGNYLVADFISEPGVGVFDPHFSLLGWLSDSKLSKSRSNASLSFFVGPHSIDFDSRGNIYICDYRAKRILKFSQAYEFISVVLSREKIDRPWFLTGPATCRIDTNDNFLVSDYDSHSLQRFSPDGQFLGWLGMSQHGEPNFEWRREGQPVSSKKLGGFDRLHSVDFDSIGNLLIADTWNHRIQKYTADGKFVGWMGVDIDGKRTNGFQAEGSAMETDLMGGFSKPVAVSIEKDVVAIAEYGNSRIQKFTAAGQFLESIGSSGSEPGSFHHPYDVKLIEGATYVADSDNKRIQKIESFAG